MIEHEPLLRLWYQRRPAKLTLQKCVQCKINLNKRTLTVGSTMAHISRRLKAAEMPEGRAGFPDFETKTMTTGKYAKSLLVSSEVIQQTSDVDDIPDKPTNQPQKVSSPAPSHHIRKCHQNSSHQLELDNFGQDVFSSGRCHFFINNLQYMLFANMSRVFCSKLQALVNHYSV